jgi:hypothetical protein
MILSIIHSLILAQTMNLNVTPIETRQGGVKVPSRQRQYVIDCRTNMTCGVDGGVLYLSAASSGSGGSSYDGGKVGEAYMADASYYAQVAVVAQTAYSADASVYTAAFDHEPAACPAGQYASDLSAAGVLTCSTPSGGGGGGPPWQVNKADVQVTLTTAGMFSQTVTATWITSASHVTCVVLGTDDAGLTPEVVAVAGLGVSVSLLNPGVGFTVSLRNLAGLEGTVTVHCTGG